MKIYWKIETQRGGISKIYIILYYKIIKWYIYN